MDVFSGDPILSLHGITQRYSGRTVLDGVELTLHRGNRLGLLGVNGAGKSTLLKIMAGWETPDEGEVVRARELRVGYLSQEFGLDPAATVRACVEEGLAAPRLLIERYHELGSRLGDDPIALAEHDRLQAEIDLLEAWNLDLEVERIMQHLQVPDGERKIAALSGGELRRVTLCRTLVARPDLLILDEPTNHLDAATIEWLEGYLHDYRGTVVLVTHDRYFLDRIADRMIELEHGKLAEYVGNYSDYLEAKSERQATEVLVEHKRQMTLKRELIWIRKQPQGRATKQQARADRYLELLDHTPEEGLGELDLVIPSGPRLGAKVLNLKGVTKRFGDRLLIDRLDLELQAGDRLGVIGPNGVGKTTLMRLILGDEPPDAGTRDVGVNTRFIYADQGRARLDPDKTVLEEVAGSSSVVILEDSSISVRTYLRRFLFTDEQSATPIRRLSGGEQNRVQLAKLLREGGNVLILDEPTNDLDLMSLRVLEEALVGFSGCALVVSHDRYFLNRVATAILAFEGDGRIVYSVGNYDRYLERRLPTLAVPTASTSPKAPAPKAPARKLSYREAKELEEIESRIEEAETEVARLETRLQDASLYAERGHEVQGMLAELEAAKREVALRYDRWQELEALQQALSPRS